MRVAWQDQDAAVDYEALYSGGLNVNGSPWDRKPDNVGIGYACLDGGNLDVKNTHVFEAYYRLGLNEHLDLTADIQYMRDNLTKTDPLQDNRAGWILGLRATARF